MDKIITKPNESRKCKITVYNYHSGFSVMHPKEENKLPEVYDVEAWCVGGDEGIFAVFPHPTRKDSVMYAEGDDGHWWFVGTCGNSWVHKIIHAFTEYVKQEKIYG
jgi:hypothetical protein